MAGAIQLTIGAQTISIDVGKSGHASSFGLVISVRKSNNKSALLVIGAPGMQNAVRAFELGDAFLYETPENGLVEVRATKLNTYGVEVLISRVTPRLGISGGLDTSEAENAKFSADEVAQIRVSVKQIYAQISSRSDVSSEKLELLNRKLEEISLASERLGRKDWIMFVTGTLTNVIVSAAFPPEAARALFLAANEALGWVFQNALRLLSM